MQLTVTTPAGEFSTLDLPEDITVENFVALCQAEFPPLAGASRLTIVHNGRPLDYRNEQTLKELNVSNNDMVLISAGAAPRPPAHQQPPRRAAAANANGGGRGGANPLAGFDWSQFSVPGASTMSPEQQQQAKIDESVRELQSAFDADPVMKDRIRGNNAALADALAAKDTAKVRKHVTDALKERRQANEVRMRAMADPFSPEAQKIIEDEIRQENIQSTLEHAMEYMPESFGQVVMLYVNVKVNGHAVKAFVDSGAQTTIMSMDCAKRCDVDRLIDIRFSGIAKGVGTQKILGKIHLAQLEIEGSWLPTSLTVLEDQSMELLLGLDMLRRHQCSIDLRDNKLHIGTTGKATPFLGEGEVPAHARLNGTANEDVPMDEDRALAEAMHKSATEHAATSSASTAPTSVQSPSTTPAATAEDPKIGQLVGMGFAKPDAIKELQLQNGDVQKAAVALLTKSIAIKPPKK